MTAHNERRQPAKLARSCGCLPRRSKHCSLPDFATLNRGPTLTTPHLRGGQRAGRPTSPVARYDSYPQPGGINPPLRLSCRGRRPPTPRRSAAVNGKDVGRPAHRPPQQLAWPHSSIVRPRGRGRTCAVCGLPAKGRLPYTRGPGMPGPYHIVPGRPTSAGAFFFVGLLIFIQLFYSATIAQIVANLAGSVQNRSFVPLGCLTCF